MAWYNIYRPSKFSDVSGQSVVKSVLVNALEHKKIKHGYLLSGPKGTGKTTLARIFANNLNDLDNNPQASMDIIELDAASNSGVDNIRNLIDSAKTPPFAGNYKVYIIDEVHMLSKSAMNALLKILEEPPKYLIFLLATTNPEKLLPTVLSRLTKLTLTSHTLEDIIDRLKYICELEKMIIDDSSLALIAKRAGGGQRDAINILETLHSYGLSKYTIADTTNLLGLLPIELLSEVADLFVKQDFEAIKSMITKVEKVGLDGESFLGQFLGYLLEQSFEVNTDYDVLILPVAQILDLKLPINTISASFALIQAKLKEKNIIKSNIAITESSSVEQKKNPKPDLVEILNVGTSDIAEISKLTLEIDSSSIASKENYATIADSAQESNADDSNLPVEIFTPSDNKTELTTDSTDIQKLQEVILGFTKSDKCVMMFKMIILQIIVERIDDGVITVSLSAPTFINQLENKKNQTLITDYLFETTGTQYSLVVTGRSASNEPLKDHRTPKEILDSKLQSEDKNNRYEAPKPSYGKKYEGPTRQSKHDFESNISPVAPDSLDSIEIEKPKTNKPSTKPAEKYFYSVYQGLPANTVGPEDEIAKIPIHLESIPKPIKPDISTNDNPDWAAEVGELFDF